MADDMKALGKLGLGLLGLMVILGLVFVVGEQFKKTICEDIDGSTFTAAAGTCANGGSQAFNVTDDVISAIELVVSFLTIIVLVLIVKLLIQNVKGIEE